MSGIKRDAADAAFSDCVRERANWTCERCNTYYPEGSRRGIECAHIKGRRNKRVRQDPDNALCLCTSCHMYYSGEPLEFTAFVEQKLGAGRLEILIEKARECIKYNKLFVKDCAKHYREQLKIMQEKRKQGDMGYLDFEGYL